MDFELTREQRDIKRAAREFSRGEFTQERAIGYEKDHEFPRALLEQAGELGFIGLDYPTEVGGGGLGVTENVLVIEEFCKADSGIGMALHLAFLPRSSGSSARRSSTGATSSRWLGGGRCLPSRSPRRTAAPT